MRILAYGLSADKLAGIETFMLNMNKYMSDDCIFDYVIERNAEMGNSTIHQTAIDEKGGKIFFIEPKKNMLKNLLDWNKLLKEKRSEYDTVYFNMYSLSWTPPVALCRLYGYRVIVHSHNSGIHNCGAILKAFHMIGRQWLKLMKVERLTNSSLSSAYMFCRADVGKLIYNAISVERFGFCREKRDEMRERLNILGKHIYGFCGRLTYEKNPLYLVEVFELIQKKDDSAILMIAGEGDMMDDMKSAIKEKGIEEKVIFLGNVINIEDYYQAMDVFLLPSLFEGLGLVLIEAQTMGLPCIASADVVPKEAKVTELLEYIPLSMPEKWAETALEMANREIEREKYKTIIENSGFNIEREARRLEKILTE